MNYGRFLVCASINPEFVNMMRERLDGTAAVRGSGRRAAETVVGNGRSLLKSGSADEEVCVRSVRPIRRVGISPPHDEINFHGKAHLTTNDGTERSGRPSATESPTDVARPLSLQ